MEEEAIKISSFTRAAMAIEDRVLLNTVKEFSARIYYINIHYLQEIAGYSLCKLIDLRLYLQWCLKQNNQCSVISPARNFCLLAGLLKNVSMDLHDICFYQRWRLAHLRSALYN